MNKLNTKGFSVVEGLLLLIAVTLIAGVGFYVYNSGKEADKRVSETAVNSNQPKKTEKQTIPEGWTQFKEAGVSFYYPVDWTDQGLPAEGSLVNFADEKAGDINVYNKNPRVYYSANTPYLCQLNDNGWQDYVVATDDNGKIAQITSTEKVDVCEERMEKRTSEGNVIYETAGGALGEASFTSVVKVNGGYVVMGNSSSYDPDTATDAEVVTLTKDIMSKVQEAANELARVN